MTRPIGMYDAAYDVRPTSPEHLHVLPPIALHIDAGAVRFMDHLTVVEAEMLASLLVEAAKVARGEEVPAR